MAEKKKKKCPPEGAPDWMLTYGDMVTLLLTFFVMLYTTAEVDGEKLNLILSAFTGLGLFEGGNTLESGRLAELGNNVMSMPSRERGRQLDEALKKAISVFEPDIKSKKVRVTSNEQGLVISLAGDAFFESGSAEVRIDETRDLLMRISSLLRSDELSDRTFAIEGHTDSIPTDPQGPFPTNFHLSTARANNVLRYLTDFGADPKNFKVTGYGANRPIMSNETEEGRAYNRRIDIIILAEDAD